jgi:hypothetical protein
MARIGYKVATIAATIAIAAITISGCTPTDNPNIDVPTSIAAPREIDVTSTDLLQLTLDDPTPTVLTIPGEDMTKYDGVFDIPDIVKYVPASNFAGFRQHDAYLKPLKAGDTTLTLMRPGNDKIYTIAITVAPAIVGNPVNAAKQIAKAERIAKKIIGLEANKAMNIVNGYGYTYRIINLNGEPLTVTLDYRTDRIDVTVQKGIIIDATVG